MAEESELPQADAVQAVQLEGFPWTYYHFKTIGTIQEGPYTPEQIRFIQILSDWRQGRMDDQTLGRTLRLSSSLMTAGAQLTRVKPETDVLHTNFGRRLLQFNLDCWMALTIAETPANHGLPFMKFPPEIRLLIYDHCISMRITNYHFATSFYGSGLRKTPSLVYGKPCLCDCGNLPRPDLGRAGMLLELVNKQISNEFLSRLYDQTMAQFSCSCQLADRLSVNKLFRAHAREIIVHWTGPKSDKAFRLLGKCRNLKGLNISVSRSTKAYPNRREQLMRTWLLSQEVRLCDTLGMDELLAIRGLLQIRVTHCFEYWDKRVNEFERKRLEVMLLAHCRRPKEEAQSQLEDGG